MSEKKDVLPSGSSERVEVARKAALAFAAGVDQPDVEMLAKKPFPVESDKVGAQVLQLGASGGSVELMTTSESLSPATTERVVDTTEAEAATLASSIEIMSASPEELVKYAQDISEAIRDLRQTDVMVDPKRRDFTLAV